MIVVNLPMSNGLPVVNSSALVKREGDSGYYSVHFHPVEQLWVMLYRVGAGRFLAVPNKPRLLNRLPDGVPWRVWIRRAPARRAWKHWRVEGTERVAGAGADTAVSERMVVIDDDTPDDDATDQAPWSVDGVTVTRARPTLPSVCGQRNPRAFLRDQVEASE